MPRHLEPPFAIIGLGLIGGSIARGLRAAHPRGDLIGVDPDTGTRDLALRSGVVSRAVAGLGAADLLSTCSTVFVCVPVGKMREVFTTLGTLGDDAIVTDVAGVKGVVEQWATELLGDATFIGGHPMAGGEQGGFERSRADLFVDAPVALCPAAGGPIDATEALATLWRLLKANPVGMTSAEHDRIVAITSHLPYLAALAQTEIAAEHPGADRLLGRGFTDATRHAAFDHQIMAAAISASPDAPTAARLLAAKLTELATLLDEQPREFRSRAAAAREALVQLIRDD